MKKPEFLDDEERSIIKAYKAGEFKSVKDETAAKKTAVQAARRYLRKDARINVRRGA